MYKPEMRELLKYVSVSEEFNSEENKGGSS